MNIAEVIKHLKTLPQDMEVWLTWDESGEYWPVESPQGRIDWVSKVTRNGKTRWEESKNKGEGKAVCVFLSDVNLENKCLECSSWDKNTKVCSYEDCDDCQYTLNEKDGSGKKQCDGLCNSPECKYGNVNPEEWNPDYKAERLG